MKFSKFHKTVQEILKSELPSSKAIVNEGQVMARDIRIGRTAFMGKMGVASALESNIGTSGQKEKNKWH